MSVFQRVRDRLTDTMLSRAYACHETATYADAFRTAVRFTRSLSHPVPFAKVGGQDVLDPQGDFLSPMDEIAQRVSPVRSAGQCLKWCLYLAPRIEAVLGHKVAVTVGQLWRGPCPVFNPEWPDVRRWARDGFSAEDVEGRRGFNMHAWLTVESGVLVDPTFLSSLAVFVGGSHQGYSGGVIWGREDRMGKDHRYRPIAVGNSIARAIGENGMMVAETVEELGVAPAMFLPTSWP